MCLYVTRCAQHYWKSLQDRTLAHGQAADSGTEEHHVGGALDIRGPPRAGCRGDGRSLHLAGHDGGRRLIEQFRPTRRAVARAGILLGSEPRGGSGMPVAAGAECASGSVRIEGRVLRIEEEQAGVAAHVSMRVHAPLRPEGWGRSVRRQHALADVAVGEA